ncbi:MAG: AAA family ATPase [Ilumatobacteraceae bacterium]
MRPLRLEFQAFGSFPGREVVDFEALARRGLFVVSGPTGAGKSTIFDAMVYALYGELPGQRAADGQARSHHADPDAETIVTFDFDVDGSRYRVRRTPKWERPKIRGAGTTSQPPTATLTKLVGAGTEAIVTNVNACTSHVHQLVGLSSKEFQRVVLLPQGEFTAFLIASDDEREKLLRRLFGVDLYEHAVAWMKDHLRALREDVGVADADIDHHRANAVTALTAARKEWLDLVDPSTHHGEPLDDLPGATLGRLIDELEPIRAEQQGALRTLQTEAAAAQAEAAEGARAADRFDRAVAAAADRDRLERDRVTIDEARVAVALSQRARPVVVAADAVAHATSAAARAEADLAAVRSALVDHLTRIDVPIPALDAVSVATALTALDHTVSINRGHLRDAERALGESTRADAAAARARDDHAAATRVVDALHVEHGVLTEQIGTFEPIVQTLPVRTAAVATARQLLVDRRALDQVVCHLADATSARIHANDTYLVTVTRFIETQAPRLAHTLQPGSACPVCGSCEHPHPAVDADGEAVDQDAVDQARAALQDAAEQVARHEADEQHLREALGARAGQALGALEDELDAAIAALDAATAALGALTAARHALASLDARRSEATEAAQTTAALAAAAEQQARTARDDAQRLAAVVASVDPDVVKTHEAALPHLEQLAVTLAQCADAATTAIAGLHGATGRFDDALAASGLTDARAARTGLLDPEEEDNVIRRIRRWDDQVVDTRARLDELSAQGLPERRPDAAALATAAARLAASAISAARAATTASDALDRARDSLARVVQIEAESVELRGRYDAARVVHQTCNGEAGMGVKLERWVLAGELERVTDAANAHLARMTGHRFRLQRSTTTRSALTLEVFDAHAGRARSTRSLSGGEQFQASLALALGLADVISQGGTASGRQFEALFVDEGFGSLDLDALDDAIEALAALQAGGRIVGAITHVEAMKERLHVGIEVRPRREGHGSTLVVHA